MAISRVEWWTSVREAAASRWLWLFLTGVVVVVAARMVLVRFQAPDEESLEVTRYKISVAAELLASWRTQHGSYPDELLLVEDLLAADLPASSRQKVLRDAWGRALHFVAPDPSGTCAFLLYSVGRNGRDERGAGDDVDIGTDGHRPGCPR